MTQPRDLHPDRPPGALLLVMITLTGVYDWLVPRTRRGRRAQVEARGEVS